MAGGGKDKLEHIKQDTPKFLRDFKARVGFKEGPTVDTKKRKDIAKRERPDDDDDDDVERDDEQPTICVLKEGDITEEEYKSLKAETAGDSETNKDASGNEKIMFKAPAKRKKEEDNKQKTSKGTKERRKGSSKVKKLDNKNLLSFADEED